MTILIDSAAFDPGEELRRFGENQSHGDNGAGDNGAIATFCGHVRSQGGAIQYMDLECYPEMAHHQLARLVDKARARWKIHDIMIRHRFGRLFPGDAIVFVAVGAPHRDAALCACQYLIDWLKIQAPFWKYEQKKDGGAWVGTRDRDRAAAARWQGKD